MITGNKYNEADYKVFLNGREVEEIAFMPITISCDPASKGTDQVFFTIYKFEAGLDMKILRTWRRKYKMKKIRLPRKRKKAINTILSKAGLSGKGLSDYARRTLYCDLYQWPDCQ